MYVSAATAPPTFSTSLSSGDSASSSHFVHLLFSFLPPPLLNSLPPSLPFPSLSLEDRGRFQWELGARLLGPGWFPGPLEWSAVGCSEVPILPVLLAKGSPASILGRGGSGGILPEWPLAFPVIHVDLELQALRHPEGHMEGFRWSRHLPKVRRAQSTFHSAAQPGPLSPLSGCFSCWGHTGFPTGLRDGPVQSFPFII